MKISYKKLWIMLIERDISPATLRKDLNIATGTMTKLRRDEDISMDAIKRICQVCNCNIGDMMDILPEEEK